MPDGMVPGLQLSRELLDPDGGATGRDSQATVRMLTGHLKYLMAFTFLTCAREFPERYYTPLATRARTPPLRGRRLQAGAATSSGRIPIGDEPLSAQTLHNGTSLRRWRGS